MGNAIESAVSFPLCDTHAAQTALDLYSDQVNKLIPAQKAELKRTYEDAKKSEPWLFGLLGATGVGVFTTVSGWLGGGETENICGVIVVGGGIVGAVGYFVTHFTLDYNYDKEMRRLNLHGTLFDQQSPTFHEFHKSIFDSRSRAHSRWLGTLVETPYTYDWRKDIKVLETE
jgi:hypothetical protein